MESTPPAPDASPAAEVVDDGTIPISRGGVRLLPAPLGSNLGAGILPAGTVVITCDDRGIANKVVERFDMFDHPTVLLRHVDGKPLDLSTIDDVIEADLSDAAVIDALIPALRQHHDALAGLIHLSPLSQFSDTDTLVDRARRDSRSLYLLARAMESDLTEAAKNGSAVLLAATAIDGRLGYGTSADQPIARAAHGGILGLVKCIGLEWPDVLVRAVDISPEMNTSTTFDAIAAELGQSTGPLEIGVSSAGRITWEPIAATIDPASENKLVLEPGEVIVMTGGARGITAEMAVGLAKKYQSQLVLLGRSQLPEQVEPAEIAAATSDVELKSALIQLAKARGETPKPAEIGRQANRIMAAREIRQTLDRIRQAGGHADYRSVDVSDRESFAAMLQNIQAEYGQIAGVVHGAGVIEDKLLRDKTPDSFDRVFNTKVHSTAGLIDAIAPNQLKFLALFASVASRFGNRGQSDYAAANEVLGKVACTLNQAWPQTRTFAVAWGPWAEIGMVADLEKHLTARGLTLIPPPLGVQMFLDEIASGDRGTPEVIIAGGAEQLATPN
ncbi:SDR family NAD(P)-dependent oxidoreductase [Rosistilla oblonga]|uniref:SDR family NAD(P)-dependent oxidoreductase n=1 Tax=Rosistilla oblonga TaxID=2527990 RepID=UPI003A970DFE